MKIRADLEGVVHVGDLVLAAGDTIPDGAVVGAHLIAQTEGATSGGAGKPRRRGSASRATSDD